jgi:hypothetical protein
MPKSSLFVQVGQRIGRGVVIDADVRIPRPGRPGLRGARLICDCGTEYVSALQALVGKRPENQRTMSCGCLRREHQIAAVTKHGMSRRCGEHPLYATWDGMIRRCEEPGAAGYEYWGGQGVTVCPEWHDAAVFITWIEANLGPRPDGMTLDRHPDTDGPYAPGNVRWATHSEQMRNRRPFTSPGPVALWADRTFRTEVCDHCGNEYETRAVAGNVRFCSRKCKAADRRASGADNVERTCHQCGSTFTCNRYDGTRHCSKSCGVTCRHAGGTCPRLRGWCVE